MPQIKSKLLPFLKKGAYFFYVMLAVWGIMEMAYRYQIIDFYATAFQFLNPEYQANHKKNVWVFGDSFTASPQSYLAVLREKQPDIQFLNGAVAGFGIRETRAVATARMKKVEPQSVIYQIYVGNDLLDIRKPCNWEKLSFARNFYWKITDYSLFASFLNYQLARMKEKTNTGFDFERKGLEDSVFSIEHYSKREKLLLQAEPNFLENSIFLQENRQNDLQFLINELRALLKNIENTEIPVYLIIIPHCVQVNTFYQKQLEMLGTTFTMPNLQTPNYPFINTLTQAFSTQKNVHILNPLPYFQQIENPKQHLYYVNDPHLNALGQRLLGEWLYAEMKMPKP